MNEIFANVLAIGTIAIGGWVAIFGTMGALLARNRGAAPVLGLLLGGLFGPLGWALVWFDTLEAPSGEREWTAIDVDDWSEV